MKNCSLIVTLPRIIPSNEKRIEQILSSEVVSAVRLNTGVNSLVSNKDQLKYLNKLRDIYKKIVWLDIKGRQLRINSWADPRYEAIELNHGIDIEYPAYITFRNGNTSEISSCRGNKIIITNPPKEAVGKGQSVNIKAKSLEVKGYLTESDKQILELSSLMGLNNIMASYVEGMDDLVQILRINPNAYIVSKIESKEGIGFMLNNNVPLMAARDDLYIECDSSIEVIKYLREIINKDKNAICASKVFDSLENSNAISLHDYEDLEFMYSLGYRNYMLGDNVSNYNLRLALKGWRSFINE